MLEEVKFVHREKILRLGEEIFERWYCNDRDFRDFILSSILIKNNKVLFVGLPGAGKSTLVRLIAKAIHNDNTEDSTPIFGMTIGSPEKTLQKVLVSTNIVKLLTSGEEEIIVRPIVKARIKFINEINRFSKSVQDALLSLLEEGYIEYSGIILRTKSYLCFADMNPFRGDIDRALKARFYASCYVKLPDFSGSKRIIDYILKYTRSEETYLSIPKTMPKIISINELEEIWKDVQNVEIPEDVRLFGVMILSAFRVCKYNKLELMPGYLRLPCTDCEYSNEICSMIQEPPDERANIALFLYGRARAWLYGRRKVIYDDILWAVPYVLAHRIEIKPLTKSRVSNPWEFLRHIIRNIRETKWISGSEFGVWAKGLALACRILEIKPSEQIEKTKIINVEKGDKIEILSQLEKLAIGEFGRGDLVVKEIYRYVQDIFGEKIKDKKEILQREVRRLLKDPNLTYSQIEELMQKINSYPAEISKGVKEKISKLIDSFRIIVNLEAPIDIKKIENVLITHGVPSRVVSRLLDKSKAENMEYRTILLQIKKIGKNLIIITETKDLANEIRDSIS
ncbi:MAG: AAA family ATPase [Candidatus Njordarchaeota archaeon]